MLVRTLSLALAGASLTATASAACPGSAGCERWTARVEGEGSVVAEAASLSAQGQRIAVVGRMAVDVADSLNPLEQPDRLSAVAAGIATTGEPRWRTIHRHDYMTAGGVDGFQDVAFAPDGRTAYAAGTRGRDSGSPDSDVLVAAYDATTGAERWSRSIDGPAHQRDVGGVLAVAPDGRSVIAAGTVCVRLTDRCEDWDWVVARLDAVTGTLLWSVRHDSGESNDEPRGVVATRDGHTAVVTGTTGTGCAAIASSGAAPCDTDTTTVAYDIATGAQRWLVHADAPDTDDQPTAIGIDARSKRVIVVSNSQSRGSRSGPPVVSATVTALAPGSGLSLWRAGEEGAFATDLAFLADGRRLVVVGSRQLDVASFVYDVIDGRRLAALRHDGPGRGEDMAWAVAPAPAGGFAVGAAVRAGPGLTDFDGAVVAYDAENRPAWNRVLPAIRGLVDVHVLPDGTGAIATGTSEDAEGPDIVAVALDGGNTLRPCRARAHLARSSTLDRRKLRLHGHASAGCSGSITVEVAAAHRTSGRRCRHLLPTGRLGRRTRCGTTRWMRAAGARRWTLRKTGRFPPGSYRVSVRATAGGVSGKARSRRLRVG